jgi:hypothetical protein
MATACKRHAALARHARRSGRRHLAAGVVPVGEHDHQLVLGLAFVKELDGEAQRIADARARPGQADLQFTELAPQQGVIECQRHMQIGAVAEDDEADAVAGAAGNETVEDLFDRAEALGGLAIEASKVSLGHRLRNVNGQQQIASRLNTLDRRIDPLRPRQCEQQQRPRGQPEDALGPAAP